MSTSPSLLIAKKASKMGALLKKAFSDTNLLLLLLLKRGNKLAAKALRSLFPAHSIPKRLDEASVAAAVQRLFDMLNAEAGEGAATPMLMPGFGKSPAVRQLRVTDSPFPVKENEEEARQVSKAAEEFIARFYRGLKREKFFQSPCYVRYY